MAYEGRTKPSRELSIHSALIQHASSHHTLLVSCTVAPAQPVRAESPVLTTPCPSLRRMKQVLVEARGADRRRSDERVRARNHANATQQFEIPKTNINLRRKPPKSSVFSFHNATSRAFRVYFCPISGCAVIWERSDGKLRTSGFLARPVHPGPVA